MEFPKIFHSDTQVSNKGNPFGDGIPLSVLVANMKGDGFP